MKKLEVSASRYAETILALKHYADSWKTKYLTLQAANVDPDATMEIEVLGPDTQL